MTDAKKEARKIFKKFIKQTNYVNEEMTVGDMYVMLRDRMHFGNAEAQVIIAALTMAGAEWKEPEKTSRCGD